MTLKRIKHNRLLNLLLSILFVLSIHAQPTYAIRTSGYQTSTPGNQNFESHAYVFQGVPTEKRDEHGFKIFLQDFSDIKWRLSRIVTKKGKKYAEVTPTNWNKFKNSLRTFTRRDKEEMEKSEFVWMQAVIDLPLIDKSGNIVGKAGTPAFFSLTDKKYFHSNRWRTDNYAANSKLFGKIGSNSFSGGGRHTDSYVDKGSVYDVVSKIWQQKNKTKKPFQESGTLAIWTYGLDSADSSTVMKGGIQIPKIGNPYLSCDIGGGDRYVFSKTEETVENSLSGVATYYYTINPKEPENFSQLSKEEQDYWHETHYPQMSAIHRTNFGEFLEKNEDKFSQLRGLGKNAGPLWDSLLAEGKKAIAKDKALGGREFLGLELEQNNIEGFSRGGLFTFTEMQMNAHMTVTIKQDYYDEYACVSHTESNYSMCGETCTPVRVTCPPGSPKGKVCTVPSCSTNTCTFTRRERVAKDVIIDGRYIDEDVAPVRAGIYSPTISYQELGVRCNSNALANLVNTVGGEVKALDRAFSAGMSKVYKNGTIASDFNNVDVSFFYKGRECEDIFACTSNKATAENAEAKKNVENSGSINNKFGAQSQINSANSDSFTFFRDGQKHRIRNDIWYLNENRPSPIVEHDKSSDALATYIDFDKSGTPVGNELIQIAFNGKTINGDEIKTENSFVFEDQVNTVDWIGRWASEKNYPHRVNLQYAYAPLVESSYPKLFEENQADRDTAQYSIDMRCDVNMNTLSPDKPIIKLSPKPNNFSNPNNVFNPAVDKTIKVDFTKSSAE